MTFGFLLVSHTPISPQGNIVATSNVMLKETSTVSEVKSQLNCRMNPFTPSEVSEVGKSAGKGTL